MATGYATATLRSRSSMDSDERFMFLVAEALDALPDWVADALTNIEILVEDRPPEDSPDLLGLYEGIPLAERDGSYSGVLPDRITLYREPIEAEAGESDRELRRVIEETLRHEIAHHFGIDDGRLDEIDAY
jgi:predicted Zn-dependent protease with MMP-like domain